MHLILTFALFLFSGLSYANDNGDTKAENFVQKRVESALEFIGDNELPFEEKQAQFETMLTESFDLKTIGKFSLGRYWRKLPKQEHSAYFDVFKDYIVAVYSQRFQDYSGERFYTTGSRIEENNDVIVFSQLQPRNAPTVRIDWRIRSKDGQFKVIDIVVEGVSMAVTQRSDFSSVIQRSGGDVETLLKHLEKYRA